LHPPAPKQKASALSHRVADRTAPTPNSVPGDKFISLKMQDWRERRASGPNPQSISKPRYSLRFLCPIGCNPPWWLWDITPVGFPSISLPVQTPCQSKLRQRTVACRLPRLITTMI